MSSSNIIGTSIRVVRLHLGRSPVFHSLVSLDTVHAPAISRGDSAAAFSNLAVSRLSLTTSVLTEDTVKFLHLKGSSGLVLCVGGGGSDSL